MLESSDKEAIGYVGGVVLALCLLPQLVLVVRRRSAEDISYLWNFWYITGLIISMVYLILVEASAGWISLLMEIVLAVALVLVKVALDLNLIRKKLSPADAAANLTLELAETPTVLLARQDSIHRTNVDQKSAALQVSQSTPSSSSEVAESEAAPVFEAANTTAGTMLNRLILSDAKNAICEESVICVTGPSVSTLSLRSSFKCESFDIFERVSTQIASSLSIADNMRVLHQSSSVVAYSSPSRPFEPSVAVSGHIQSTAPEQHQEQKQRPITVAADREAMDAECQQCFQTVLVFETASVYIRCHSISQHLDITAVTLGGAQLPSAVLASSVAAAWTGHI